MGIMSNFEAAVGFEPTNNGFADPRLRPLGHAANKLQETFAKPRIVILSSPRLPRPLFGGGEDVSRPKYL